MAAASHTLLGCRGVGVLSGGVTLDSRSGVVSRWGDVSAIWRIHMSDIPCINLFAINHLSFLAGGTERPKT